MDRLVAPNPGTHVRVLCFEDQMADAGLMMEELSAAGFAATMDVVAYRDEYVSSLAEHSYDAILVDHTLPDCDGYTAIELGLEHAPGVPILVVSGTVGEDTAVEFLKRGASDYVLKDRMARLGFAVQRALDAAMLTRKAVEAEAVLQRERVLLQALVDATPDAIFVKDLEGRYLLINAAVEVATGLRAADTIGKDDRIVFGEEYGSMVMARDSEVLRAATPVTFEEELTWPDGSVRTYLTTKGALRGDDGEPYALFGAARDVTDRLRLEAQLRQSQKMEAIGQLAAGIAHDFNNMLSVVVGHADLALTKLGSHHEVAEDVGAILAAAEQSAGLTRQLLAFSREGAASPDVVDLNEEIRDSLRMLRRIIGEHIEVCLDEGPRLWPVRIDRTQLAQVLANLSTNSRDAIEGHGRVDISTRNADVKHNGSAAVPGLEDGRYVVLDFSDNGAGMSPEVQRRALEPFFTTKEVGRGTGLGMSIIYGIVKQLEGAMELVSHPGAGTTVSIYIPRAERRAEEPAVSGEQTTPRGSESIMVVEDEAQVLNLATVVLGRLGYRVASCQSAEEALERIGAERIDLLLTDVVMPGMNGDELARRVKELVPDVAVVFMSGYADTALAALGLTEGLKGTLQKPFTLEEMAATVRRALDS